jgi:hypothetical protein
MEKARTAPDLARSGVPGAIPVEARVAAPPMRAGAILGRLGWGFPQSPELVTQACQTRAPQGSNGTSLLGSRSGPVNLQSGLSFMTWPWPAVSPKRSS